MKYFLAILLCLFIGLGIFLFSLYRSFGKDNIALEQEYELFIHKGFSYDQVVQALKTDAVLIDYDLMDKLALVKKYKKASVPSGRYVLTPTMSSFDLVNKLRAGNQDAIRLTISQARYIDNVAGQLAKKMSFDSLALLEVLVKKSTLDRLQLTDEQSIVQIIPNTYEVFWDLTPEDLVDRLHREYNRFWDQKQRRDRAEGLGLSLAEVSTLASIVEKESIQAAERPVIAGLYLNRLKANIPLQADPTVVFGLGDFEIRRVLLRHLSIDTPYNTYKHGGLPPGPICLPSIASIDAVLNASDHNYLYMCAKPGYNGAHLFAETLAEHERNASVYRRWLNAEGIF